MSDKFSFTYSAPTEDERKEVAQIKKQYAPLQEKEIKLMRLRKLNRRVHLLPKILGVVIGTIGVFTFGLGMAFVLQWSSYLWGSLISVAGAAVFGVSFPTYKVLLRYGKKKFGSEILTLSDELLN